MDFQYAPVKKLIYVKQHVMDSIKRGQSKVLINPNFMKPPVVHVNPHFKAKLTIHVNPNVIKPPIESAKSNLPAVKPCEIMLPNPIQPIITRNKVVRVSTKSQMKNKYIKVNPSSNSTVGRKHPFRIDNRTTTNISIRKKVNKRLVNLNSTAKNIYVKASQSNTSITKQLQTNSRKKARLLTIRGEKYKLHSNNRTLTLLSHKAVTSNDKMNLSNQATLSQKRNLYVKNNISKRILLSSTKNKSINVLKNKLKKSNMPCPFYRKFGRCKGKENGTCIRMHNCDQVSLCPKFLQGACRNNSCLLSHKVSAEKMPTCRFYLEGLCAKDGCPYLHVKMNANAEICRDFLEGFCKKAAECDKRHQYLCPDFELKACCKRRKCQYPHRNVVRENKVIKSVPPKLQTLSKINLKLKPCSSTYNKEVPEKLLTLRYYDGSVPKHFNPEVQTDNAVYDEETDSTKYNINKEVVTSSPKKRPTLGDLPSFIPFMFKEELR